jgi:hypothetical protein
MTQGSVARAGAESSVATVGLMTIGTGAGIAWGGSGKSADYLTRGTIRRKRSSMGKIRYRKENIDGDKDSGKKTIVGT